LLFLQKRNMMLKVGVLGAGHLGKIHLKLLQQSKRYDLIGFYDASAEIAAQIEADLGYTYYSDIDELIAACDVIDVVTPTSYHHASGIKVLEAGKHLFIEKPITVTVEEAEELISLSRKHNVKGQVGQVERFNPAFRSVADRFDNPMFIETHRLAEFNPRGTDVSVVLDLMIHDIDAILSVVKSKVKSVSASGVSVISETPDIANARIEFENGCVANLTASRISLKKMRKARFFQKDAYISVDFLTKKVEVVRMKNAPEVPGDFDMILQNAEGIKKQIYFDNPDVVDNNAILEELETFADAIENDTRPIVNLEDGTAALDVALKIIKEFRSL
jgi:predicted dehydrogenase